ncbi:MAG TPA: type III-A CRISPR-associated RAMP protein Csm3 [Bacteroidales bacterium]|nr:type III-A CRISPR-associated RAMP protein Csm3 [Bacteroidales bacterium]
MEKLTGKIVITGKIVVKTGLHIGGSKSSLDIGGVDLNVIKTPHGVPFIPGSSLKGKLRSLLAREEGSLEVRDDSAVIKRIFGDPGDKKERGTTTRLAVRDSFLDTEHFIRTFHDLEMDFNYSEVKWENTINRKTGTAEHPRQIERVPAGAQFSFEMIYDVYDNTYEEDVEFIIKAMHLLCDDYLGGQGTRGYGKTSFSDVKFELRKTVDFYGPSGKDRKSEILEFSTAKFQ